MARLSLCIFMGINTKIIHTLWSTTSACNKIFCVFNEIHTNKYIHIYLFIYMYLITSVTETVQQYKIPFSAPFSKTLSWCPSLNVAKQAPHQNKTTGKIILLYSLTFTIWTANWKAKDSGPNGSQHSPQFNLLLISSWVQFELLRLFPNIWTFPHFQRIYYPFLGCSISPNSVHKTWTFT